MKYSKEKLEEAIKESRSIRQVIEKLGGPKDSGSVHFHVSSKIKQYGIDISHFTGQAWSKGKTLPKYGRTKDEILIYSKTGFREKSNVLRQALLESGVKYKCKECGLEDIWNNKPLRLHIEHINGDGLDSRIDNLCFLCPNCHSQTKTYCRKKTAR